MMLTTAEMIKILLNKANDISARDDMAMDLAESDDVSAIRALFLTAQDIDNDKVIIDSCIESIAQILYRNIDEAKYFNKINPHELHEILLKIKKHSENIYQQFELEKIESKYIDEN